jgi:hypothetical protein
MVVVMMMMMMMVGMAGVMRFGRDGSESDRAGQRQRRENLFHVGFPIVLASQMDRRRLADK